MCRYLYHCLIALDQLLNATLGGYADETLSSRAYRRSSVAQPKRRGRWAYKSINTLFFWQPDHCRGAYEMEAQRRHLPVDFKET